jgi:polyketide biosynthesis acyl carrier protein
MSQDEIFAVIVRHTRAVIPALNGHRFSKTDSLRALGADSDDRADIVMLTLQSLGLYVPLGVVAGARNIAEMAEIILARS